MKFRYPFQKVLDVKAKEKKNTESMLAQALAEVVKAEQALAQLEAERARTLARVNEEAQRGQKMAELIAGQEYVRCLDGAIRQTAFRLSEAERRAEEIRALLLERTVEEKVWLKAREKAFEDFKVQESRIHQHELDEIATNRSRIVQ